MKIITKKKEKQLLKEECWSLDHSLILWLNEHLKVYLEDAGKMVDLEFHKIKYGRKTYTQKELIERLIVITNILSDENAYYGYDEHMKDTIVSLTNEMYDILKVVHFYLWW